MRSKEEGHLEIFKQRKSSRRFQAKGTLSANVLRHEQVWLVSRMADRPLWLEPSEGGVNSRKGQIM